MSIVTQIEAYIKRFATFTDEGFSLPIALWIMGTYVWPEFDAFPYMVITSDTKRSGKTRLAEICGFVSSNPRSFGAMTPATLFRTIADEKPTIFFDEAEVLSGESANTMRSVLNMGYRKGSTVPRVVGGVTREFPTYCPKVFILIGDVYDTLKDRSIIIRMKRAEPRERFTYEMAKGDGEALRVKISALLGGGTDDDNLTQTGEKRSEVISAYLDWKGIEFLTDRDEEIWTPLFAIASVICPERMAELSRIAVDMATEKTQERRRYVNLLGEEKKTEEDESARRLLSDLATVINGDRVISSAVAVEKLRDIPTGPWRKFRGEGITAHNLGDILSRFGVRPGTVRIASKSKAKSTIKGYKLVDVKKALEGMK